MYIKLLIGAYAGEIRDVRDIEARRMIAVGHAINPYAPVDPAPVIAEPVVEELPQKKRGKQWSR